MTLIKDRCDTWIQYVRQQWLNGWLRERSALRDSTRNMVNRMKTAAAVASSEEAWSLQERLKRLSDGFDKMDDVTNEPKYRYEKPEVYLECALISYDLGDLQEALTLLRVSNGDFPRQSMYKAVSYWLYGCIQWQLPAHSEDAILSWERSMQVLREAEIVSARNDPDAANTCREVINLMNDAINKSSRDNIPPPPPSITAAPEARTSPATNARASASKPAGRHQAYAAKLKVFPFYGTIRAGDPVHALDYPDGATIVEKLEVDGRLYQIYSLKAEGLITLNPTAEYFVMKVKGDSMNVATPLPILEGDAVLLLKTKNAQDRDIVAGVIRKEDADATLKRYREKDGKSFVYESDKTTKSIPLTSADYIQGVVVAILKPSDD